MGNRLVTYNDQDIMRVMFSLSPHPFIYSASLEVLNKVGGNTGIVTGFLELLLRVERLHIERQNGGSVDVYSVEGMCRDLLKDLNSYEGLFDRVFLSLLKSEMVPSDVLKCLNDTVRYILRQIFPGTIDIIRDLEHTDTYLLMIHKYENILMFDAPRYYRM